jgi:Pilus formation protein N terminal region
MTLSAKLQSAALAVLVILGSAMFAHSAEPLTVYADHSQIVNVNRAPGTIVVGNPSIADVTVQGNQLFVHGRVYGKTNVIVLDEAGKQIAEYDVNVLRGDEYDVGLFMGGGVMGSTRQSFTCKGDCEATFQIGDSLDYYKLINEQQNNKIGIAQGQKPGESKPGDGAPAQ